MPTPGEFVFDYLERIKANDAPGALTLFAEEATFCVPGDLPFSGVICGAKAVMEPYFLPARDVTVPGTKELDIGRILAEGEYVAAQWTSRRKITNGRDYENFFFALFHVQAGEIQSLREYFDTQRAKETLWPDHV